MTTAYPPDDPGSDDLVPGLLAERILDPRTQSWLRNLFQDQRLIREIAAESDTTAAFWANVFRLAGWRAKPGTWKLVAAIAGMANLLPAVTSEHIAPEDGPPRPRPHLRLLPEAERF